MQSSTPCLSSRYCFTSSLASRAHKKWWKSALALSYLGASTNSGAGLLGKMTTPGYAQGLPSSGRVCCRETPEVVSSCPPSHPAPPLPEPAPRQQGRTLTEEQAVSQQCRASPLRKTALQASQFSFTSGQTPSLSPLFIPWLTALDGGPHLPG